MQAASYRIAIGVAVLAASADLEGGRVAIVGFGKLEGELDETKLGERFKRSCQPTGSLYHGAAFHEEVARIVSEFYSGHKTGLEAIDMDAPFGKLTTQVVGILSRLAQ